MSSHTLQIASVDLDIAWADRAENLYAMNRIVTALTGRADIIVLPELFSTGFVSDSGHLATLSDSDRNHPTLDAMKVAARRANAAICGSILHAATPVDGKAGYVNRCLFVEPSGEVTHYDKHHLFCMGSESRTFIAGNRPIPVVRFRGANVSMAVCFDLRFPSWLQNRADNPYDILLVPSNWPQERQYAWNALLCARAIENQAYVVGANRSGKDDMGTYDAMTRIYDPSGQSVGVANPHFNATFATADLNSLRKIRNDFPVLKCAD